jgi:hypothetical protein
MGSIPMDGGAKRYRPIRLVAQQQIEIDRGTSGCVRVSDRT